MADSRAIHGLGRLGMAGFVAALLLLACGCANQPQQIMLRVPQEVPPPPGVNASLIRPHDEPSMVAAGQSWSDIIATFSLPDYLQGAQASIEASTEPVEMPIEAQHAYAYARQAMHERKAFEAIFQLNAADRESPNHPDILRALADIYRDTGNLPRSAEYYQRLIEIDPNNPAVLYELGRIAVQRGEEEESIAVLARARQEIDENDSQYVEYLPLLNFQLAEALAARRYDREAIHAWMHYLKAQERPRYGTGPASAELYRRRRHLGMTWVAVGDAHNRLNEPEQAIASYNKANEHGVTDTFGLGARMAYTHLLLGDVNDALDLVAASFNQQEEVRLNDAAELAKWLGRTVPDSSTFLAQRVQLLFDQSPDSSFLAIVLADLLPVEQGDALLRNYLERDPRSRSVYAALLERVLNQRDTRGSRAVADAIDITAIICRPQPRLTAIYAGQLTDAVGTAEELLDGFAALPDSTANDPVVRLLHGACLENVNDRKQAETVYTSLLDDEQAMTTARASLARMLVKRGEFSEAARMLHEQAIRGQPDLIALRAEALIFSGRMTRAKKMISHAREEMPLDIDLILADADIHRYSLDVNGAASILEQAIAREPREERLYQKLLDLYDPLFSRLQEVHRAEARYTAILAQMGRVMPQSATYRKHQAHQLWRNGDADAALALLQGLLEESPDNRDVLDALTWMVRVRDDEKAAMELLKQHTEKLKNNPEILNVAVEHLLGMENLDEAEAIVADALKRDVVDPGDRRVWYPYIRGLFPSVRNGIGALERRQLEVFNERMERLASLVVSDAGNIQYYRAVYMHGVDQEKSEAILLELLKKNPDHPEANNQLGYTWADDGENLERALEMIKRSVKADPDSPMYIDSLGWAYYKLGRFDEAIRYLRKAVELEPEDPVLMDHLGDALYKAGRVDEAVAIWNDVLTFYDEEFTDRDRMDEDDERVRRTARIKVVGVRLDREIPVADVPGESP